MCAVAAQKPCVVQRHDGRNRAAELWNGAQVEIKPMEVVAVQNVGTARGQIDDLPGSRIIEVLDTPKIIQESRRLRDPFHPAAHAAVPIQCLAAGMHRPPELRPADSISCVTDREHIRIAAGLVTHRKPRLVPSLAIGSKQVVSNPLSTAAELVAVDLKNAEFAFHLSHASSQRSKLAPSESRTINLGS